MNEIITTNAVITGASIEIEDHGFLTIWLTLDYGGSGQGFGGYALFSQRAYDAKEKYPYAADWLWQVMQVAGVEKWDKLPGKTIRVVREDWGKVHKIGHIIKDIWWDPAERYADENDS